MDWTVPGLHAKKSTFTGLEFTDGSIWMCGSEERVPTNKQVAYKIFSRQDGSTFRRSMAKPYSNKANREKWKATQYFKEYAERHQKEEESLTDEQVDQLLADFRISVQQNPERGE